MVRRAASVAVFWTVLSGWASADDYHIWLRSGAWFSKLEGDVAAGRGLIGASRLDIDALLDTPGSEETPFGGISVELFHRWRIHFDVLSETYRGDIPLTTTITFRGRSFEIGTGLITKIEFTEFSFMGEYIYPLYEDDLVSLRAGPQFGLKVIDMTFSLKSQTILGLRATLGLTLPIPLFGAHVELSLPHDIGLDLTALGFVVNDLNVMDFEDLDVNVLDLTGRIEWGFGLGGYVAGGYRYRRYKIGEEGRIPNELDTELSGPFVELGFRF